MDIRKFFGKRIVQSAPSNGLGVGSSEVGKDEVASSIARAQYAKKSPFFERSSPPKRILADDSSNIEADQTCLVSRTLVFDECSQSVDLFFIENGTRLQAHGSSQGVCVDTCRTQR